MVDEERGKVKEHALSLLCTYFKLCGMTMLSGVTLGVAVHLGVCWAGCWEVPSVDPG